MNRIKVNPTIVYEDFERQLKFYKEVIQTNITLGGKRKAVEKLIESNNVSEDRRVEALELIKDFDDRSIEEIKIDVTTKYIIPCQKLLANCHKYKWFDLGVLSNKDSTEVLSQYVETDGLCDANLKLPFENVVFSIVVGSEDVFKLVYYLFCDTEISVEGEYLFSITPVVFAHYQDVSKNSGGVIVTKEPLKLKIVSEGVAGRWHIHQGILSNNIKNMDDGEFLMSVPAILDYILNLLSCDYVYVRKENYPVKLNKKREKKGYYKVPTKHTIMIFNHGEVFNYNGGRPHTSPMRHLRRGHIRHLLNGKTTWVKQCLVGKFGSIIEKNYRIAV